MFCRVSQVRAEYWLTEASDIRVNFTAVTDEKTPVNLTNHACWNLSGGCSEDIKGHLLHMAHCDRYLPVDAGLIPTGEVAAVAGSPFDFHSAPRLLAEGVTGVVHGGVAGLDHSFVVSSQAEERAEKGSGLKHILTLTHAGSGRELDVWSDQPAVQIYTSNFLPHLDATGAEPPFCQHYGVCIENQGFPDAVNQPQFPSIWLAPGDEYRHHTVFSLRVVD
jgi:aldose 1-epimerase